MVGVPDSTTTPSGATPNLYLIPVADSSTGALSTATPNGFFDGDTDVDSNNDTGPIWSTLIDITP
jgi:hypothetical protein